VLTTGRRVAAISRRYDDSLFDALLRRGFREITRMATRIR
jgi:hypothetical protein